MQMTSARRQNRSFLVLVPSQKYGLVTVYKKECLCRKPQNPRSEAEILRKAGLKGKKSSFTLTSHGSCARPAQNHTERVFLGLHFLWWGKESLRQISASSVFWSTYSKHWGTGQS